MINIRRASNSDLELLVEHNLNLSLETENINLDKDIVAKGVLFGLNNPNSAEYYLAEINNGIVGSLMVTKEWSDWRSGFFYWIQSVYIKKNYRRKGVYKTLHNFITDKAIAEPDICGIRLYVEKHNEPAMIAYKAMGMNETHYKLFEIIFK